MHWDRLFADLEDQFASQREAEHAALESEAERLRVSQLSLHERLMTLAARRGEVTVTFTDGLTTTVAVDACGADWVGLRVRDGGAAYLISPVTAIAEIGMPDYLARQATARPPRPSGVAARTTFGYVLRDLARRRIPVAVVTTSGRVLTGTLDRAGVDHVDLAEHDAGAARRATTVTRTSVVAFATIARVRVVEGAHPA
ncbi:hypothetical protein ACFQZV_12190 [Microbacterium koreense]|uniref:Fis family transcriptional regulator n=1 Tax=Microbacterium koreense TaxID=323761 RepID=A0ABW2ZUC4_9MICO